MKVSSLTLGCRANAYDTDAVLSAFAKRGYEIAPEHTYADIYIINTCSVTNIADRKSRQAVERVLKLNPEAVIVMTGCYAQVKPDAVKGLRNVHVVCGTRDRNKIVDSVERYLSTGEDTVDVTDLTHNSTFEAMEVTHFGGKARAELKVQDGCNNFCTYCIIPYTRGRISSLPVKNALEQTKIIMDSGIKEIVLTGIHIASYGRGTNEGDIISLTERIHEITEGTDIRLRFGSLDPEVVTEEFAERMSRLGRFCPQFHLSLQSGSDTVLKRMNRHYTSEEYYKGVELLRKYFDDPAFTTDIIVGFPGETDEEFNQTVRFAERVGFAKIHIFPYSRREGTLAARMKEQIPSDIASARAKTLGETEKRLRMAYTKRFVGKERDVLFEETKELNGKIYACGYTPEYLYVYIEAGKDLINKIRKVRITEQEGELIFGVLV